jgi:hypothetical protein
MWLRPRADPKITVKWVVAPVCVFGRSGRGRALCRRGDLWNSGNSLFGVHELLSELKKYEPAMVSAVEAAVAQAVSELGFLRLASGPFADAPKKSIDHAAREKTSLDAMVEGRFRWSSIGSWDASTPYPSTTQAPMPCIHRPWEDFHQNHPSLQLLTSRHQTD